MVKDAALRQAEAQRVWIDGAMLQRKHKDTLAMLGALIYERILAGDLRELEDDAEVADAVGLLEELEVRMDEAAARTRQRAADVTATAARAVSSLGKGGRRPRRGADTGDADAGEVRVWRPVVPDDDDPFDDAPAADDDGTVSALGKAPRGRTRPRRAAHSGAGIRFVADELADEADELAEYMHPDDVPDTGEDGAPRPRAAGDTD